MNTNRNREKKKDFAPLSKKRISRSNLESYRKKKRSFKSRGWTQ
jgi:hypothetical protein